MSDLFVYRSRDPEVVGAWKDASEAISAYVRATQAVLDAAGLGAYQCYRHTGGWNPGRFAGLAVPDGEAVPAGWRMTGRYAVPDKRTKAGRDIAAALEAVRHPGDPLFKLIGMPPDIASGNGFSSPAVRLLEDGAALYVTWQRDPDGAESFFQGKAVVDRDRWEHVKLSAYYAEVERAKAPAGAP